MQRELLLLGLLRRHKMHGYKLMEFIDQNLTTCINIKKSTAYYLLDKMKKKGWVNYKDDSTGNRPPRRVYHITETGEHVFHQILREQLATYNPINFEGDSAFLFFDELPVTEQIEHIQIRLEQLNDYLSFLENVPAHSGNIQITINHQIHHLHSEQEWLGNLLNNLNRLKNTSKE